MDPHRLDDVARSLAAGASRRRLLAVVLGLAIGELPVSLGRHDRSPRTAAAMHLPGVPRLTCAECLDVCHRAESAIDLGGLAACAGAIRAAPACHRLAFLCDRAASLVCAAFHQTPNPDCADICGSHALDVALRHLGGAPCGARAGRAGGQSR